MEDSVREFLELSVGINNLYCKLNTARMNLPHPEIGCGYIESALAKLEQAEECLDTAIEYMQK